MFETHNNAELFLPKALAPNGERLWSYVGMHVHVPWFYIEYAVDHENMKLRTVLFLSSVEQLKSLTEQENIEITQAHVVTPGYVNKTGTWKMDRLKQVVQATNNLGETEFPVSIYVLMNGKEIIFGSSDGKSMPKHREVILTFAQN